jgi:hypothetical protein
MEIGKLQRSYTIEPIEDPVPAAVEPEPAEEQILPVAAAETTEEQPSQP